MSKSFMLQVINNELANGWDGFRSTAIGRFVVVEFGCGTDCAVLVFEDGGFVRKFQFDAMYDEEHYWDIYRFIVEAVK